MGEKTDSQKTCRGVCIKQMSENVNQEIAFSVMRGELCLRCLSTLTEENNSHSTGDYEGEHDESFCKDCYKSVRDWIRENDYDVEPMLMKVSNEIITVENVNEFEDTHDLENNVWVKK